MAGHSKWAQIKRKKAKNDDARGKEFTKMAREIMVAVREGRSGDINGNFRLRQAVTRAKAIGLPNDNIDRAIQKGLGAITGDNFESIQYEGYGPGGVAVMIDALTDNRNRTAGDIRSYFNKCNGNLGETGCVNWMFDKKGVIRIAEVEDPDALMMEALEAGAEDLREDAEIQEVLTSPEDFEAVVTALQNHYTLESSDISYLPQNTVQVTELDIAKKLVKLLDLLEDHDDVQAVHSNFEMDESVMESLEQ
ncbi:YebC/PmpR family DNA-binding transcriptional regulator [bacterium (Candidatus Blackallbacteria) CG17_big_fil_post_rev_8_21_14_2_50_48_46]|uniref:Probable transcriptional regulatory protein COW36_01435 n=1 Tax=bacterium (Candidatus Blackallbacteria) CG17_big_fil_post_rev_8_21_14_2_50_48_46 TaxID=2014261 RepID=A0A2M7GBL6_9BACT|nr:MAG: YebC/PmpR family DNA-binding transcriptional regulator [bacterium (Candidatus Blackallbacteria) CG18_big_fil_WC_8_21_14_2_50_49_26]PIW19530.1 MAG: YebC/PmpR family DNA-binding transcriptional regulator [bacterium (Candidatus Blackallbacteria) CG17_big_fil_post_rev_8_21_14_2_50_48_46]PIW48867.1 MAG: YebC/PmpR family DNA-binding transcriptional regulator [bacterium (Candidatus Blackallbacteria) CG13_big_fil_rev_8_21_14_2_50_49_14]